MSELHPLAQSMALSAKRIAERRAELYAAIAERDRLRDMITSEIERLLAENPKQTNSALARHFGFASETSVRKIRARMQEDAEIG